MERAARGIEERERRDAAAVIRQCLLSLATITVGLTASSTAAETDFSFDYRGYFDAGAVHTDQTKSWLDGGSGKGRYGANSSGDNRFKPVLSEAALIGDALLGPAWRAHLHVKFDDQQQHLVDIAEGYVSYRSPPRAGTRLRFRAGTFLPPVSLENHGIGWTSPYTLSSSALNSWIGEELRINGGELKAVFDYASLRVDLFGAVYFANDAAGKLLGARGFAVHDRELGVFDRTPLPRAHSISRNPFGPFAGLANTYEPLHEIDGRPGFYVGANVQSPMLGRFSFMYYDNNGDPEAINRMEGHYAWATRFGVIGYRGEILKDLTFVTQSLYGKTAAGPRLIWTGKRMSESTYFASYGLLHKQHGRIGVALRGEVWEVWDRDRMLFNYDGAEDGYGVTLSTSIKPWPWSKISAELQYLDHDRPVRVFGGEPRHVDELSLRINFRIFFMAPAAH